MTVRPAKTQISLGIRPVWSESLPSAWRKLGSVATHWAHSEDSDQTGRMPRLIWVFVVRTCHFIGFVMRQLNYQTLKQWPYLLNLSFLSFTSSASLCVKRSAILKSRHNVKVQYSQGDIHTCQLSQWQWQVYTVNSLLFAKTLFSLIFANLIPRKFNITPKNLHKQNLQNFKHRKFKSLRIS